MAETDDSLCLSSSKIRPRSPNSPNPPKKKKNHKPFNIFLNFYKNSHFSFTPIHTKAAPWEEHNKAAKKKTQKKTIGNGLENVREES